MPRPWRGHHPDGEAGRHSPAENPEARLRRSLHSWSFYRLQQFIAYKAGLAGIRVEWVNPKDTSRAWPRGGPWAKKYPKRQRLRCRDCG
ncbi:IS200/IS605 family accessory protein TnpB-related protein [Hydrogenibacillus schlegelii]|uniref:IS200/IS605 family accessory protein TnpB-related protein n=1 Tax=Hydrogenibacillus schlegelii TaxID=1484 RepID=UPI003F620BAD